MALKSKNIVFVHGLFGWGPSELGGLLPYWGDALGQIDPAAFSVHEAKVGPISSFHDRACELFAQIRGGTTDYGREHSERAGHARFGKTYGQPFVQNWSAGNPVILIGHSAGAHTCLQLQALLARDVWGLGTTADWVEVVVSSSGVLNGSLLTYRVGCDPTTGKFTGLASQLLALGFNFLGKANQLLGLLPNFFDFGVRIDPMLDHWTNPASPEGLLAQIDRSALVKGEDNLAFNLTLQGCLKANQQFSTNPNTHYFSMVTDMTRQTPGGVWATDDDASVFLKPPAISQTQTADFAVPPIPGWGDGALALDRWRDNDGAVSVISQERPFTARAEPAGDDAFLDADPTRLGKGLWHSHRLDGALRERMDHFDTAVGARIKAAIPLRSDARLRAHRRLYRRIGEILEKL